MIYILDTIYVVLLKFIPKNSNITQGNVGTPLNYKNSIQFMELKESLSRSRSKDRV